MARGAWPRRGVRTSLPVAVVRRKVAEDFSPAEISGLALWLDASDASTLFQDAAATTPATATSDPVGYWADKSGNGRHAVQATEGNRPAISATNQGGKKALAFASSTTTVVSPATVAQYVADATTSPKMFFAWVARPEGGAASIVWGSPTHPNNASRVFYAADFGVPGGHIVDFGSVSTARLTGTVGNEANNVGHVYSAFRDGAIMSVRRDGVEILRKTNTSGVYSDTTGTLSINTASGGSATASWMEFLAYAASMPAANITRIERYLAARWGITLAPQVSNADAQDWINRVYANGGEVSTSTASAVNQFCNDIDTAGLRSSMYRANLFCGTGLNACLVPLYRGPSPSGTQYGNTTDTNSGGLFVAGDYSETLGLLGGGSRWLNTGFKPQDAGIPASSVHLSAVWSAFTHGTSANVFPLAMINANATERHWLNVNSNTTPTTEITASAGGNGATGSIVDTLYATNGGAVTGGLRTISRTTSSLARLFLGATQRAQNTDAMFNTLSTENLSVFARWNGSTTFGHFAQRMMGYSAGLGMDSAQVAAFNTAITNFNAAMGRSI